MWPPMAVDDLWFLTKCGPDGERLPSKRNGRGKRWRVRWIGDNGRSRQQLFKYRADAELYDANVRSDPWYIAPRNHETVRVSYRVCFGCKGKYRSDRFANELGRCPPCLHELLVRLGRPGFSPVPKLHRCWSCHEPRWLPGLPTCDECVAAYRTNRALYKTCRGCRQLFLPTGRGQSFCPGGRCATIRSVTRRRSANVRGSHSHQQWLAVLAAYGGRCAYCRTRPATAKDHVRAVTKRGTNRISNILPACQPCNSSKGDRPLLEWVAGLGRRYVAPRLAICGPPQAASVYQRLPA